MQLFGAAALAALASAGTSQAAIITTSSGPTYNYEWAAFPATAIDSNVTVTTSNAVNMHNYSFNATSSRGIQTRVGTGTAPFSVTFLYEFQTPAGFMFTDASVFERRSTYFWGFDPKPTLTSSFSVDGGITWTTIPNPVFGNGDLSSTDTPSLNALNSAFTSGTVTDLKLRYVAAAMRDDQVLGMFVQQFNSSDPSVATSGAGFIVNANIAAIPEPSTTALLSGVGILLLTRRVRKPRLS